MIQEVSLNNRIPLGSSRALLRANRWSKEQVCEGLGKPLGGIRERNKRPFEPYFRNRRRFSCEVCCEDSQSRETLKLECGDIFCLACQRASYEHAIKGGCLKILCPGTCGTLVQDEVLEKVVSSEMLTRFKSLQNDYFVSWQRGFQWCPAPNCGYAIKSDPSTEHSVECRCETKFCFSCKLQDHAPCPCNLAQAWLETQPSTSKGSGQAESGVLATSKAAKFKKCPSCHIKLEKNGGCAAMCCTNCRFRFDWNLVSYASYEIACMSAAVGHKDLDLSYFHKRSKHYEMLRMAYRCAEESSGCALLKAFEDLNTCLNTLKWIYILGGYIISTDPESIFEERDAKLGSAVDSLFYCLDKGKAQLPDLVTIAHEIQAKVNLAVNQKDELLNFIARANSESHWSYSI